jgi:hypothetical protein
MKYYNESYFNNLLLSTEIILNYSRVYTFFKLVLISFDKTDSVDDKTFINDGPSIIKSKPKDFNFSIRDPAKKAAFLSLIKGNIEAMVKISNNLNVPIVFMRYHLKGYRNIYAYQEQLFQQLNVPYINNLELFLEAEKRGINPFGPDNWHPGDIGYLLIAKNVLNKLVQLGFVKTEQLEIF